MSGNHNTHNIGTLNKPNMGMFTACKQCLCSSIVPLLEQIIVFDSTINTSLAGTIIRKVDLTYARHRYK